MFKHITGTIIILAILLASVSYGQNSLIEGYILTSKGEKITGYIHDLLDEEIRNKIKLYSSTSGSDFKEYTAADIEGFGYGNGRFFKSITENNGSTKIFAKMITIGKVEMYVKRFKDKGKLQVYLFRQDTAISAILNPAKKTTVSKDGKSFEISENKYLNLLSYITGDKNLEYFRFNEKNVKNKVNEFNQRFQSSFPVQTYDDRITRTFDVVLGTAITKSSSSDFYRVAVFRDKQFNDRSRKFYYRQGISILNETERSGDNIFVVNLTPFGLRNDILGNRVKFYWHGAIGMTLLYEESGGRTGGTKTTIWPGLNFGLGARVKLNSNDLVVEVSPSLREAIMINIGLSF